MFKKSIYEARDNNGSHYEPASLETILCLFLINSFANRLVVAITTAACNNLTIGACDSLVIATAMILDIKGTVADNGSFSAAGKITFSGIIRTFRSVRIDKVIAGTGVIKIPGAATEKGPVSFSKPGHLKTLRVGNKKREL